jgi:FkbH-like protein
MKSEIKQHIRNERYRDALELMLSVRPSDELDLIDYAANQLAKIPPDVVSARAPTQKRLAVLGGATTHFLLPLVRLFAARRGLSLTIYESDYGLFEQEIWSDSTALREFAPDLIHFHVSSRNLPFPAFSADPAALVEEQARRFGDLYRATVDRFRCAVVTNNFETEAARALGALDATSPGTKNSMIRALNEALVRKLPSQVYVNDIEHLSSVHGKARWSDARLWNETKTAVSFECQPFYADRLAATLGALFGKSKKCLVLDLDNTVWGGVIGDDGLHGIRLGAGQPEGEAFHHFQTYVKALKERGVLLAVASKNELENALAAFREHDDMVLKESDISCFVVNWEPKDGSVRQIAKRLNIGIDSLVFFDDNPAERQLVRDAVPEVTVIDVPVDPSLYVQALDDANLFDAVAITEEDRERTASLQQNQARESLEAETSNYDDFLRKLQMRAVIEPISESNLARVTQLINKTNQFNLTTIRMTEADVRATIGDARVYTSTMRLDDRFGSNGLISVVMGHIADDTLIVDNWLMSCRVLKRGVEALDMERLLAFCEKNAVRLVVGRYLPTSKNKLVEKHYAELGFTQVASDGPGTSWQFKVAEQKLLRAHHIAVEGD